jgi:hypothetical protein
VTEEEAKNICQQRKFAIVKGFLGIVFIVDNGKPFAHVGVHCIYIGFLNHTLIMKKIILLNFCNYSGIKLSIPLILSLSKDKADVKTGSWFDKLTMSVLKTLAQNT